MCQARGEELGKPQRLSVTSQPHPIAASPARVISRTDRVPSPADRIATQADRIALQLMFAAAPEHKEVLVKHGLSESVLVQFG